MTHNLGGSADSLTSSSASDRLVKLRASSRSEGYGQYTCEVDKAGQHLTAREVGGEGEGGREGGREGGGRESGIVRVDKQRERNSLGSQRGH